MKQFTFILTILIVNTLQCGSLDLLKKFEKEDEKKFIEIVKKATQCIEKKDYQCAESKINQIKAYVNHSYNLNKISELKLDLMESKQKPESGNLKNFTLEECTNATIGGGKCILYVNGKYDGLIFFKLDKKNGYDIYSISIRGSKYAKTNAGYYDPSLHMLFTSECGTTKMESVMKLKKALKMFANCSLNGNYRF